MDFEELEGFGPEKISRLQMSLNENLDESFVALAKKKTFLLDFNRVRILVVRINLGF